MLIGNEGIKIGDASNMKLTLGQSFQKILKIISPHT